MTDTVFFLAVVVAAAIPPCVYAGAMRLIDWLLPAEAE